MNTNAKRILIAAGGLVLALATPALSAETTGRSVANDVEAWDTGRASGDIPFPQLPWMSSNADQPATADGVLAPRPQTLGPFLLQPIPATRFSSNAERH